MMKVELIEYVSSDNKDINILRIFWASEIQKEVPEESFGGILDG